MNHTIPSLIPFGIRPDCGDAFGGSDVEMAAPRAVDSAFTAIRASEWFLAPASSVISKNTDWIDTCHRLFSSPMMKIQVNDLGDRLIFEVEGRLAGIFVPELEQCWRASLAMQPARQVLVDLKDVTCVDRAGRSLLHSMHCDGVLFLRAGMAIQDILEQIMEEQECKQH